MRSVLAPLSFLLLVATAAEAQTNEERARFLYEAANRAIEKQDWSECVDSLERAQKALGRNVLRLQAPLVRCLYELKAWNDVVTAAKIYYKLEGADPSLQEYQEIGALLVEAEKNLERERAAAAELAEAERLRLEAEARKQREQREAQLAEQERLRREAEKIALQQRREREAYVAAAPARKAAHLAEAERESSEALGRRLFGVGMIAVALVAAGGGVGGVVYGFAGLSDVEDSESEGLLKLGALAAGVAAICAAGWLALGMAPDEFSAAELHDMNAESFRDKASEEDAFISGSP